MDSNPFGLAYPLLNLKRFQNLVKREIQPLEDEVAELKAKVENKDLSITDKEALYDKIDSMTKVIDEKIEEALTSILPEAFAVVVETARRWAENGKLVVTTQDFDRELATKKDGITPSFFIFALQ